MLNLAFVIVALVYTSSSFVMILSSTHWRMDFTCWLILYTSDSTQIIQPEVKLKQWGDWFIFDMVRTFLIAFYYCKYFTAPHLSFCVTCLPKGVTSSLEYHIEHFITSHFATYESYNTYHGYYRHDRGLFLSQTFPLHKHKCRVSYNDVILTSDC